ncbi:MAG TPA: hypothetical protein VLA13_09045 [Massilibacterium sp.]|nr:hypothetical protein [Massilibacterium sp.]
MGAKPLVIGYENQLIEVVEENKDVWSSHPFIALTDGGKKVMKAVEGKEIQKVSWAQNRPFRN